MPEWEPELVVDEALVRRLLAAQVPGLAAATVEPLGVGWDSAAFLVDGRLAFRFPQRAFGVAGLEREARVMPRLAPLLPLPVPVATVVGRPGDGYPWPFLGARCLPGSELPRAGLHDRARIPLGAALGAFCGPSTGCAACVVGGADLPPDPNRRTDAPHRVGLLRERLATVARLGLWQPPAAVERLLEAALGLPPAEPSAVVHGDLHVRHVLVDAQGGAAGVIDWADCCRADPSADLAVAWSALSGEARSAFLAAYGPVSREQELRARVLALFLSAALGEQAAHDDDGPLLDEALAGLRRSLA
ncbi:MAG: phosphotransferase [Thermoleophilia bacterium]